MVNPGPCLYMEKIATGREAGGAIDITVPIETNIKIVALAKGLAVSEVTVMILDRPRHEVVAARPENGRARPSPDRWRRRQHPRLRAAASTASICSMALAERPRR